MSLIATDLATIQLHPSQKAQMLLQHSVNFQFFFLPKFKKRVYKDTGLWSYCDQASSSGKEDYNENH